MPFQYHTGCSTSFTNAVRYKQETEYIQWGGKNKTVFVYKYHDYLWRKSKESTKTLLVLISNNSKVTDTKLIYTNQPFIWRDISLQINGEMLHTIGTQYCQEVSSESIDSIQFQSKSQQISFVHMCVFFLR